MPESETIETKGPGLSWADLAMKTPAEAQTTPTGHPFVWGEGKEPSQAMIDKFDAQAKKGPQRGLLSLHVETFEGSTGENQ